MIVYIIANALSNSSLIVMMLFTIESVPTEVRSVAMPMYDVVMAAASLIAPFIAALVSHQKKLRPSIQGNMVNFFYGKFLSEMLIIIYSHLSFPSYWCTIVRITSDQFMHGKSHN